MPAQQPVPETNDDSGEIISCKWEASRTAFQKELRLHKAKKNQQILQKKLEVRSSWFGDEFRDGFGEGFG